MIEKKKKRKKKKRKRRRKKKNPERRSSFGILFFTQLLFNILSFSVFAEEIIGAI